MFEGGGEEKGDKAARRWSLGVVAEVLRKVRGAELLRLALVDCGGPKYLPVDVLVGEGYKDLVHPGLFSPLSPPTATSIKSPFASFSFRLRNLTLFDLAPHSRTPQDWQSTLLLFSSGGNLAALDSLDCEMFYPGLSLDGLFFPTSAPGADSLVSLELPSMAVNLSSWRLALFALLCRNLSALALHSATAGWYREILPYLSPALPGRKEGLR
ncbi:hypothetical protein JCM8547_008724 [Rhodosporidiobolus lusitaniae]